MTRGLATIVLAAGCWAVWAYSPVVLEFLRVDDLDIPGRVCAVFLFLTMVEVIMARLKKP